MIIAGIVAPNSYPSPEGGQHVTLVYMGDDDTDTAPEFVAQLQRLCGDIAQYSQPFEVTVDAIGELGDAYVLFLDGDKLSELRGHLLLDSVVQALVSGSEQFPTYTPHMTVAYMDAVDAEPDLPTLAEPLTIIGLSLWTSSGKHDFFFEDPSGVIPVAVSTPVIEASAIYVTKLDAEGDPVGPKVLLAAAGKWDPSLHPRGKDGKFIRKFGIIKFLDSITGAWSYGQVVGIEKDKKTNKPTITIRPSDLKGKPTGKPDIDLPPSKIYSAPKTKAHLKIANDGVKKVGGQAGSNPGGLYEMPAFKKSQKTAAAVDKLKAQAKKEADEFDFMDAINNVADLKMAYAFAGNPSSGKKLDAFKTTVLQGTHGTPANRLLHAYEQAADAKKKLELSQSVVANAEAALAKDPGSALVKKNLSNAKNNVAVYSDFFDKTVATIKELGGDPEELGLLDAPEGPEAAYVPVIKLSHPEAGSTAEFDGTPEGNTALSMIQRIKGGFYHPTEVQEATYEELNMHFKGGASNPYRKRVEEAIAEFEAANGITDSETRAAAADAFGKLVRDSVIWHAVAGTSDGVSKTGFGYLKKEGKLSEFEGYALMSAIRQKPHLGGLGVPDEAPASLAAYFGPEYDAVVAKHSTSPAIAYENVVTGVITPDEYKATMARHIWPNGAVASEPTEKFYVKKAKSKAHGNNEALANALYEEAGVYVPEVDYDPSDGNIYSKIVPGKQDMADKLASKDTEWMAKLQSNFAVDAWLANWDVFGLTLDNIMTDENGEPVRIDNGGALLYRAQGAAKGESFGSKVLELDKMRSGHNKSKIYGSMMSKEQELDGAQRILAISPARIEELVAEHDLPKSLADTLKARRKYVADYYNLPLPETMQPSGSDHVTSAPLVDPYDVASSDGLSREWSRPIPTTVALNWVIEEGDEVWTKAGVHKMGTLNGEKVELFDHLMHLKNVVGGPFRVKKGGEPGPRPTHNAIVSTAPAAAGDLVKLDWQRGDRILVNGALLDVIAVQRTMGRIRVAPADGGMPYNLNAFNLPGDSVTLYRWDPDAASDALPSPSVKTGMAVDVENQLKADLVQPLPAGSPPKPAKAAAAPGAGIGKPSKGDVKSMVVGDGTTAATGDKVVSKKDGKTYVFVKPKGYSAVVYEYDENDPNPNNPKLYMKTASTLFQPDKSPDASVPGTVNVPKSKNGIVPVVGMKATDLKGNKGTITYIYPDGKSVLFLPDGGNKKTKKTTTALVIDAPTEATEPVFVPAGTPDPGTPGLPGHSYGDMKASKHLLFQHATFGVKKDKLIPGTSLVWVAQSDGSIAVEKWANQPDSSMYITGTNSVACYGAATLGSNYLTFPANELPALPEQGDKTYGIMYGGMYLYANNSTVNSDGTITAVHQNGTWYQIPADAKVAVAAVEGVSHLTHMGDQTSPVLLETFGAPENTGDALPLKDLYSHPAFKLGAKISPDGQKWYTVTDDGSSGYGSVTVDTDEGVSFSIPFVSHTTFFIETSPAPAAPETSPAAPEMVKLASAPDYALVTTELGPTYLVINGMLYSTPYGHPSGSKATYYDLNVSVDSDLNTPIEVTADMMHVLSAKSVRGVLTVDGKQYHTYGSVEGPNFEKHILLKDVETGAWVDGSPEFFAKGASFVRDTSITDELYPVEADGLFQAIQDGHAWVSPADVLPGGNASPLDALDVLGKSASESPVDIFKDADGDYLRLGSMVTVEVFNPETKEWEASTKYTTIPSAAVKVVEGNIPDIPLWSATAGGQIGTVKPKLPMLPVYVLTLKPSGSKVTVYKFPSGNYKIMKSNGYHTISSVTSYDIESAELIHDPWNTEASLPKEEEFIPHGYLTPMALTPKNKVVEFTFANGLKAYASKEHPDGPWDIYGKSLGLPYTMNDEAIDYALAGNASLYTAKVVHTGAEHTLAPAPAVDTDEAEAPKSYTFGPYKFAENVTIVTMDDKTWVKSPSTKEWTPYWTQTSGVALPFTFSDEELKVHFGDKEITHVWGPQIDFGKVKEPSPAPVTQTTTPDDVLSPYALTHDFTIPAHTTQGGYVGGWYIEQSDLDTLHKLSSSHPIPAGAEVWTRPGWKMMVVKAPDGTLTRYEVGNSPIGISSYIFDKYINDPSWKQIDLKSFGTPTVPPATLPQSDAWKDLGNYSKISSWSEAKAGMILYESETNSWVKLSKDTGPDGVIWYNEFWSEANGQWQPTQLGAESDWWISNSDTVKVLDPNKSLSAPAPSVPGTAPEPTPTGPAAPEVIPGVTKADSDAAAAWGGSLTKTGHVPYPGMDVTGIGGLQGKIVSVSKDKTKATVLKADGSKTTRLITALKSNITANYAKHLGPVVPAEIPEGMTLPYFTPKDVFSKVFTKPNSLYGLVNGHAGIRNAVTHVRGAVAPSGKKYARVHFTMTTEQRAKLFQQLQATKPQLGAWTSTGQKSLTDLAAGDIVSLRNSSSQGEWVIDRNSTTPTHRLIAVNADGYVFEDVNNPNTTVTTPLTKKASSSGKTFTALVYAWDPTAPAPVQAGDFKGLSEEAKMLGWTVADDGITSGYGSDGITLIKEPGVSVPKSVGAFNQGVGQTGFRITQADGTVIEVTSLKPGHNSLNGVVNISIPEGGDTVAAYAAAMQTLGMSHAPQTQENVKAQVRPILKNLVELHIAEVDSTKKITGGNMSDDEIFQKISSTVGISDVGWQDVRIGMTDSLGKVTFYWSDRVVSALSAKSSWNMLQRGGDTSHPEVIASTVKTGSVDALARRYLGYGGHGISPGQDATVNAGHGSFMSGGTTHNFQSTNHLGMGGGSYMVYHHPSVLFSKIQDYRTGSGGTDAYGTGGNHTGGPAFSDAKKSNSLQGLQQHISGDLWVGTGLGTDDIGFIGVNSQMMLSKVMKLLAAEGITHIGNRPVSDVIMTIDDLNKLHKPEDMLPWSPPPGLVNLTDLPES